MKAIKNNTLETMNAPQVLSDNELQNVAGGGFWENAWKFFKWWIP